MSADYLFQQDKPYDVSYDTGDKAMQCGRHNDIFKLWLMWRSKVLSIGLLAEWVLIGFLQSERKKILNRNG